MADRPILFSAPMVRAILDGRKTQTRRVLGTRGRCNIFAPGAWTDDYVLDPGNADWRARDTPFAVGDRLWVRETWTARMTGGWTIADARRRMFQEEILYAADGTHSIDGWWPSIHMPREFSRLTLVVTEVRAQRLQSMTGEDAKAEGAEWVNPPVSSVGLTSEDIEGLGYELGFMLLWNSLNEGRGYGWDANPWVVAVTFDVVKANIDALPEEASDGIAAARPLGIGQRDEGGCRDV